MSKKLLRKKLIFIRKKKFKKFENIETKIFDIIKNIKFKIKTIGGYYPINYEFDCLPVLKKFKTVGLSFSFQEIEKLPVNKFDKKLDFIITENKIYS